MESTLLSLIKKHEDVALSLFPRVAAHLGVDFPITDMEWARFPRIGHGQTADGVKYEQHGCGLVMSDGVHSVDIDIAPGGEIHGFHRHQLFRFAEVNKIVTPYTSDEELQVAVDEAVREGSVTGYVYCHRRGVTEEPVVDHLPRPSDFSIDRRQLIWNVIAAVVILGMILSVARYIVINYFS